MYKRFKKWANPGLLFRLFSDFSNKQYKFYSKSMWKMSIQYTAPGLEHTTSRTRVVTHRPGLLPYKCTNVSIQNCVSLFILLGLWRPGRTGWLPKFTFYQPVFRVSFFSYYSFACNNLVLCGTIIIYTLRTKMVSENGLF